jgi:4-hydroxythreonine-4-phosphate dehydrogenase
MKPLVLTSGDPAGIGPEVALKAAHTWLKEGHARPLLLAGNRAWMTHKARTLGMSDLPVECLDTHWPTDNMPLARISAAAGQAAFESIRSAVALCMRGLAAGIVTAPIHKEALAMSGHPWPGHTEMLAELANPASPPAVRMMLVNPDLRVVLHTVHMSLRDVLDNLDTKGLVSTLILAKQACQMLDVAEPRIAVAGLNPHAGEGGLFGREDIDIITPAVAQARTLGIDASGPWPGDTVFMRARQHRDFDAVIAQYHDQGLIPIKYLGLDQGVNLTLGLPFIRTSVDHGTAFDIVGRQPANAGSMLSAIALADQLARQSEQAAGRKRTTLH